MIIKLDRIIVRNSTPVINNRDILQWMVDNQLESYRQGKKNLAKNLLSELTNEFGPANEGLRLEFMTKVWVLEYKELIFNVFTAKGKGTSIEVCGMSDEEIRNGVNQEEIIEFLSELHSIINK